MVKKFNKRQLIDQCGFTAEETQVILDYQKKLPILVENDDVDGFCINARYLYDELTKVPKVSKSGKQFKTVTQFSDWIKKRILDFGFDENTDYILISEKNEIKYSHGGDRKSIDYMLNLDMAKQLAMIEKTEIGNITRRYFILMEKAVKKNTEWELIRYPLREGYKKMQTALNEYMNRMVQRDADDWDYSIEADALNVLATGFKAREIRSYVGCKDNITRDSLTATYNEYLLKLQELNIVYLGMNMNRYDRYKMLEQSFNILFPNAVPIKDDVDVNRIIENKNSLIEEVRKKAQRVA